MLQGDSMATKMTIVPGIVKDGVVVPQERFQVPDGAHVSILVRPAVLTPELLRAELEQWEKASDEAWAMIDGWEESSEDRS